METDWNKAEMKEFAKMWQSKVGQKYIEKMTKSRNSWIEASMLTADASQALANARTAYGIDLVISDILAGIKQAEDGKEATATKDN